MPSALARIPRTSLSAAVYEALAAEILEGRLQAGDALPAERALAERFEVNRHAVREALKRLEQAGLVRVSQGGATRVRDWRHDGGLDLLTQLGALGEPDGELLRSALEMRLCIGVDAARRCAERAPAPVVAAIEAHVASLDAGDAQGQLADRYEELWRLVVHGAGNLAYRLALNSLVAESSGLRLRERSAGEAANPAAQRALADAIAARDPDAAEAAAHGLLERTLADALREATPAAPFAAQEPAHG